MPQSISRCFIKRIPKQARLGGRNLVSYEGKQEAQACAGTSDHLRQEAYMVAVSRCWVELTGHFLAGARSVWATAGPTVAVLERKVDLAGMRLLQ